MPTTRADQPTPPSRARRRASHSLPAVLTEAVALLDEAGEGALTFRALATRLGGGVGSIYWYVAGKEELLDRAADHVMAEVLATVRAHDDEADGDPLAAMRVLAVTLFEAVAHRPWLGAYFMRNTEVQPSSLALYDLLGRHTLQLDLTPRERFEAVSAVMGFVVGTAADLGQAPPPEVLEGRVGRDELLDRWADRWRAMDADDFPFLHHVADEFAGHDDGEQFRAGLDLILAGLRLQAGR